jgi:hypothetical protein
MGICYRAEEKDKVWYLTIRVTNFLITVKNLYFLFTKQLFRPHDFQLQEKILELLEQT